MSKKQTSLSFQLEKLATPATSQLVAETKGRASFLYSYSEALSIDCDTHYSLCVSGLKELKETHPELITSNFQDSLFSEASKSFERGLRSKEENELLDTVIDKYLIQVVAPTFMLESSHKVLEYLIYKYRVNEFNRDSLLLATLPYHETNLFAKILQTIPSIRSKSDKWYHLLHACQKRGVHLPKHSLISACVGNPWILDEVASITKTSAKMCQRNGNDINQTLYVSFATAIFIGVLSKIREGHGDHNNNILIPVLSFIEFGIRSKNQQFVLAAYSVTAILCCKVILEKETLKLLTTNMMKRFQKHYSFKDEVHDYFILLLSIILDNQEEDTIDEILDEDIQVVTLILDGRNSALSFLAEKRPCFISKVMDLLSKRVSRDGQAEESGSLVNSLVDLVSSFPESVNDKTAKVVIDSLLSRMSMSAVIDGDNSQLMKTFLLILTLAHHGKDVRGVMRKMESGKVDLVKDANLAVDVIDSLTLMDEGDGNVSGLTHRIPFDVSSSAWKSTLMVLEIFSTVTCNFNNSTELAACCIQLLSESFVIQEEADCEYFRKLLNRTISRCLDCPNFDLTNQSFQVERVLESLRYLRKEESAMEALALVDKTLQKMSEVMKDKEKESLHLKRKMLDSTLQLFGFSSAGFADDGDLVMTTRLTHLLTMLLPTFPSSDEGKQELINTVIDSLYDVLPNRRIGLVHLVMGHVMNQLNHQHKKKKKRPPEQIELKDSWFPFLFLSLIHKSLMTPLKEFGEFYQRFSVQLLESSSLAMKKAPLVPKDGVDQLVADVYDLLLTVSTSSSSSKPELETERKMIGNPCYESLRRQIQETMTGLSIVITNFSCHDVRVARSNE